MAARPKSTRWILARVIGTVGAALAMLQITHAHLRIEESGGGLVVIADQAPLGDILDQLSERLRINLKSNLPRDVSMSGHFSGTVDEIIRRLFDGYDFVTARRQQMDGVPTIQIIVIGRSNSRPVSTPSRGSPLNFDGLK